MAWLLVIHIIKYFIIKTKSIAKILFIVTVSFTLVLKRRPVAGAP